MLSQITSWLVIWLQAEGIETTGADNLIPYILHSGFFNFSFLLIIVKLLKGANMPFFLTLKLTLLSEPWGTKMFKDSTVSSDSVEDTAWKTNAWDINRSSEKS